MSARREPSTREYGGLRRALVLSAGGSAATRFAGAVGGLLAARLLGPAGRPSLATGLRPTYDVGVESPAAPERDGPAFASISASART